MRLDRILAIEPLDKAATSLVAALSILKLISYDSINHDSYYASHKLDRLPKVEAPPPLLFLQDR